MLHVDQRRAIYGGKWFRADKGAAMPSSCVLKESCGVQAPGWLNGQIPSREAGIVQRQVCFNFRKDCCYYSLPVQIKKCSDFFVYKIKEVHPIIPGKYCFTTNTLGRNRSPLLGACNYPIFLSRRFHRPIYFQLNANSDPRRNLSDQSKART